MTYATITDWLDEIESFGSRRERLADSVYGGRVANVMPWLETAWRLGELAALHRCNDIATEAGNDERHTREERIVARGLGAIIRKEIATLEEKGREG